MIDLKNSGLSVVHDRGKYSVLYDGRSIKYEAGSMMCEYMRFSPEEFRVILLMCPYFESKITDKFDDKTVDQTLKWVYEQLYYKYPPVIVETVYAMLIHDVDTYIHTSIEVRDFLLKEMIRTEEEKKILNSIFKGTSFSGFDDDHIGQALLFAYYDSYTTYMLFKSFFDKIMDAFSTKKKREELSFASYEGLFINQNIDFKILNMDGKLSSLYKIKDAISLLAFEVSHISGNTQFVKCRNCGNYFVPAARSDTVYCSYRSPQKPSKTCKEIGAQVTRAKKEKTDEVTRLYRKVYMKYKMRCKRHPDDEELKAEYARFSAEAKEMMKLIKDKEIPKEYFFKWIRKYDG